MNNSVKKRKQSDNSHFAAKCALRREAISQLKSASVLDCFAGQNRIWKSVGYSAYLGIEKKKGKGDLNIYGDNLKIIKSLDLSKYNVIDLDSYGIPAEQLIEIVENKSMPDQLVIIYTAIASAVANVQKRFVEKLGLNYDVWQKCQMLWNKHALSLWYLLLYKFYGVETVNCVIFRDGSYEKHYGYFVLKRSAVNDKI